MTTSIAPFLLTAGLALSIASLPALAAPKSERPGNPHSEHGAELHLSGPRIDIDRVRIVLGENRQLLGSSRALPPGIAKNLARGKPLPPGIARNFDARLLGQLPRYDGYEWKQAGTDVVLVAIATGLIYEVLRNVLD